MTAPTPPAPLKPGRKLDPTLELTVSPLPPPPHTPPLTLPLVQPSRLAQRAFRARKAEREHTLLTRIEALQSENASLQSLLLIHTSTPPPPPPPTSTPIPSCLPAGFDFLSAYCPVPLSALSNPTRYFSFCLALHRALPPPPPLSPAEAPSRPAPDAEVCCGGFVDCSGPLFEDDPEPAVVPPPVPIPLRREEERRGGEGLGGVRPGYISVAVAWSRLVGAGAEGGLGLPGEDVAGTVLGNMGSEGGGVECWEAVGLVVWEKAVCVSTGGCECVEG